MKWPDKKAQKEEPEKVPRCRRCMNRLTVVEDMYGRTKLWCMNCEAPLMK